MESIIIENGEIFAPHHLDNVTIKANEENALPDGRIVEAVK